MITNKPTAADDPEFAHSGFFVLRTPLLPFAELLQWSEGLEAASALDSSQLEQALARDRAGLRARLDEVIKRQAVQEAVFVACPGLEAYVDNWRREPETRRGRSVERTLVRYLARMAGRATPFGLFAGPAVGRIGDHTRLLIEGRAQYQRHTRVDLDYLFALIESLNGSPALKPGLTYRQNSSLYSAAGRIHYVEARIDKRERSYHLVAVDNNEYLAATLERASAGASISELAGALVDDEITPEDAAGYIEQLIDSQILVPDLRLSVTGREPLEELIDDLEEKAGVGQISAALKQVQTGLAVIDAAGLSNEPERYRIMAERLSDLPTSATLEQSFQSGQLFQVDLSKPAPQATLGRAVIDELIGGLGLLHKLSTPRNRTTLARFRDAFAARYEDREVPLVEALDDEAGLGFTPSSGPGDEASPLIAGLAFPFRMDRLTSWGNCETLLLSKLTEALRQGAREITIEASDLDGLEVNPSPLPDAFAVTAVVAAASETALEAGDFRVLLDSIDGPSGACLLGRFCHADGRLQNWVEQHLRAEEALRPDAVFAEIVHLPEGRVGNILCRPVMRDYEIAYLGGSGASQEKQIPITDLRLRLEGNRLCLRSASLDREVIPRLTSAHNYNWQNVPVYTFLCALQEQDVIVGAALGWGKFENAPYLPRVTSGRLVLSLARWRLNKQELTAMAEQRGAAAFKALQQWRAARGIPRWVALADGDNILPIDFDNILSLESFLHLLKGRREATLMEIFPEPDQLCVRGPEGRFVHELIVPFVRSRKDVKREDRGVGECGSVGVGEWRSVGAAQTQGHGDLETMPHAPGLPYSPTPLLPYSHTPTLPYSSTPRRFPPGTEWLYAKIYTGMAATDQILRDAISPVVAKVMETRAADRWFFIRYGDPENHLRLRLHGPAKRLRDEVMPALDSALLPMVERGLVWRVQYDTYEREVERYGGADGIELAERLFHADSEAALEIVEMLERGDEGLVERWQLTLCGIDRLLDDLGFDAPGKKTLMGRARREFAAEFRADKQLIAQIGSKFRDERRRLETLLDARRAAESPLFAGLDALRRRSEALAQPIAELRERARRGLLSQSLEDLAASYIHMHANRLLRSAHRAQELVIYSFLARLYESQAARMHATAVSSL